jgi:hypothetical protein
VSPGGQRLPGQHLDRAQSVLCSGHTVLVPESAMGPQRPAAAFPAGLRVAEDGQRLADRVELDRGPHPLSQRAEEP